MNEKKNQKKLEQKTSEEKSEIREIHNPESSESPDEKNMPKPHSVVYFKNKKTGEWEVRNPASSYAYNYISRNELPDD
ncbi:MAG: hypothetical protein JXB23_14180 [Candidatus Aminicenantes bacterium]|nr:hypothetical protein [Candidatus Aminicenantes bacterium]